MPTVKNLYVFSAKWLFDAETCVRGVSWRNHSVFFLVFRCFRVSSLLKVATDLFR